jgi:CheY-like chemotaxis protein
MTAILGWSRMIQSGQLDDATLHRGIAAIARNAELQARLIEDVLDVSRIITGNITLALEPCSPAAIVREVVEGFQPAATDKRLSVQATMTGAVDSLLADPGRLRQIVSNLVANAVKFTPEGGRIDVSLEEAGGRLHVTVRDSGVGIDPAFLPHAFDRFRQADGTTTRQYGGLGLGLAIVRDLVKLHGGEVAAESAGVGRGTTVHVWLPITRPTASAPAPSPESTSMEGHLRGLRALVVEDEPDAREFLSALLERHGMQVRAVASVPEALAALAGESFDVVLSDIGLPGRDGYALVESLRADGSRMPAIAITAFARTQDRDRAAAAGFDRHIAKPFRPHEVIRAVAEVALGRAAGERS